ncbi:MAG TPA: WG repeat-containing protein, partial [Cyclobacteriaceae bacterium]|nr:WG repeat-containing protein [Cyclobacteriaceae bacterium]
MPAIQAFNTMRDTTVELSPHPDENGKYGYVNKEMEFVIPARYSSASSFTSTGFAIVSEAKE